MSKWVNVGQRWASRRKACCYHPILSKQKSMHMQSWVGPTQQMFGGYLRLISVYRLKMTPKSCCEFIWNTNLSISQMQRWQDYLFLPRRVESSTMGIVVKRFCCGLFSINVFKLEVCFPEPPSLYICKLDFVKRGSHTSFGRQKRSGGQHSLWKLLSLDRCRDAGGFHLSLLSSCGPDILLNWWRQSDLRPTIIYHCISSAWHRSYLIGIHCLKCSLSKCIQVVVSPWRHNPPALVQGFRLLPERMPVSPHGLRITVPCSPQHCAWTGHLVFMTGPVTGSAMGYPQPNLYYFPLTSLKKVMH